MNYSNNGSKGHSDAQLLDRYLGWYVIKSTIKLVGIPGFSHGTTLYLYPHRGMNMNYNFSK